MSKVKISKLKKIKDFNDLIEYLRDELDWPIEVEDAEDITFDYDPKELGIEGKYAAKINIIKQVRPLVDNQPWGLFYIEFESKRLPVVVLRRILRALIHSRRNVSNRMKTWDLSDLIFISTLGEEVERKISFAHFSESDEGLPVLKTFSWDSTDTYFHYLQTKLDLEKLSWPKDEIDIDSWRDKWSSAFKLKHREVIRTSKQLATLMAHLAIQIREQVKYVFEFEIESGPLHRLFNNFKKTLIHDLVIDDFADMYAQTIAYGLFSARVSHEDEFTMDDIIALIPNTNPFLKNLFNECTKIGEEDLDKIDLEELGVRELILLLKKSNIEAILSDFGKQKKGEDPVIHFYEVFLEEYNAEQKVRKGVFYTPDAVVSFIVRSINKILQEKLMIEDGLANGSVFSKKNETRYFIQILDPATGTGTFLKYVIKEIKNTFNSKYRNFTDDEINKKWNDYVYKNLLSRLFGFELMMAPYAVAHLKLGLTLKETGYYLDSDKRLGVYLTNTLEGTHAGAGTLDSYLNWLADEVNQANKIKLKPITIILGNPPYSKISENKSPFIDNLMEDYKKGVKHEKKYGVLEDDYIKFIRFAHWKLEQIKIGILGYITNNSYLSGVIHRAMRKTLLESFDEIYILNLHGSSRIVEKTPDGHKDENVFDIQQGVAIALFIKRDEKNFKKKVYFADLWGIREEKYTFLNNNDINTIEWIELTPKEPYYLFIPQDISNEEEYYEYMKITNIFKEKLTGVETKRDKLAIDFSKKELIQKLNIFTSNLSDDELKEVLKLKDSDEWNVHQARNKFRNVEFEEKIYPYAYRPFDTRWICYDSSIVSRKKYNIMKHLLKKNIAIVTTRMLSTEKFLHAFVSKNIGDRCLASIKTRETSYFFPLYLYEENRKQINYSNVFLKRIKDSYEVKPPNKEIFYYVYAILFSNNYRERYNDFLKVDFPRIPIPSNINLLKELSKSGKKLILLHLNGRSEDQKSFISYGGVGDNIVSSIGKNSYKDGNLKINQNQYFKGIPEGIYNFCIGSYQVCQKWLKDRKGRRLTENDIKHFHRIIQIINESLEIIEGIDEIIEKYGGWPIK